MELFWGVQNYDWDLLYFVSKTLELRHKSVRNHCYLSPSRLRHLDRRFVEHVQEDTVRGSQRHSSLVYELDQSRRKRASDPRDRIYAKLGHFSAAVLLESLPPFQADYTLDIVKLYTDVAIRTLQGYQTLELLNAVQHLNGIAFNHSLHWHTDDGYR